MTLLYNNNLNNINYFKKKGIGSSLFSFRLIVKVN